jgi:hypothetical protein
VGLRWWNEVNPQTGDSHWVFESADPETRTINATDRRFFWLALYAQPALWIVLGAVAIIKIVSFVSITPLWITLVSEYNAGPGYRKSLAKDCSHCVGPYNHKHPGLLTV